MKDVNCFRLQDVSFAYPGEKRKTLSHISLDIKAGEFLCLCGPSGCGKSTLLRQLKTAMRPHGIFTGEIFFHDRPLELADERTQSAAIGFVQQNPEHQLVTDKVWHELAFGLESLGYDTPTIRGRVAEMASFFGIQDWFYQDVTTLSGGQKQLLNLASIMAMEPKVLILDEPSSQLDPIAAGDFLTTLGKINRELGVTVILTEHRLEDVLPMSDRVLLMEDGIISFEGTARQLGQVLAMQGHEMLTALPTPLRVYAAVSNELAVPISVRDGRQWLDALDEIQELPGFLPPPERRRDQLSPCLRLDEVFFRYTDQGNEVLRQFSCSAYKGELLAILGGNGTGKSTALAVMAGIHKANRGKLRCEGRVALLPQDPQSLFLRNTVEGDLCDALSHLPMAERTVRLEEILCLCGLKGLEARHPYDLSGGEQQRLALAKVLLSQPEILLLDEPTKGLDGAWKLHFADILQTLKTQGLCIVMVSHDLEFCAQFADHCALFFDGSLVTQGSARRFFAGNRFYTTAANRMAGQRFKDVITVDELIQACGGSCPPRPSVEHGHRQDATMEKVAQKKQQKKASSRISKGTLLMCLCALLLVPLTIWVGVKYLDDRKYYFISLLVLLECMLPFFLIFEKRRPKTRDLVVLAVLCALAVAGRAAFFMLPQWKPVMSIVILTGVALGMERGFLLGALSMFVSNMLFGHGAWTPFQMFAMGLVGLVAALLFHQHKPGRGRLAVFGFLAAVVIYGGIMNPASALMWQGQPNLSIILAYLITGLPMDLVHGAGTAFFLWFLANPVLEKLERIKVKYDLWGEMAT